MFSQPLSEDFTVEVIGIPLKVRNEEIGVGRLVDDGIAEGVPLKVGKKDIGVLALYREIKEGQSSGFATIAPNILQEGANNLASLVSVLISEKNRQAMQAKISLVAQSSHEFKGLLRNLKSMPKKLQEASEKANKAELEAEINRVIRDTNSDLGIDPAKSNIEKDLKELQDLMVIIDPDLMGEALRNLISNAMNSMPQGGKVKICARPDLEKRNAIITISDTGIGMSRKKLESVRRCLSGEGKGTGWGLAIASSQISLQGGTIVIDSEKGRGTTVTVTLPLSPKED
jgi:signal transduction histidine kinase